MLEEREKTEDLGVNWGGGVGRIIRNSVLEKYE
jgi:hypothetical protein